MKLFSKADITNLCRLCLEENNNLKNLGEKIKIGDNEFTISELLENITGDTCTMDGNIPKNICRECEMLLKATYYFRQRYDESCKQLETYMQTFCKQEEEIVLEFYDDEPPDLNLELNEPSNESEAIHTCLVCQKKFTANDLRTHIKTHRTFRRYLNIPDDKKVDPNARFYAVPNQNTSIFNRDEKFYKCVQCNDILCSKEFAEHIEEHNKGETFPCTKCKRTFRKPSFLKLHETLSHSKNYRYVCDQCEKGFHLLRNYKCHLLTHNDGELPLKCEYCEKRFSNVVHLQRHKYIHTENTTYMSRYNKLLRCSVCYQSFQDDLAKSNHVCMGPRIYKQGFRKVNKSEYTCQFCGLKFETYIKCYKHIRKLHPDQAGTILCSVCGIYVTNLPRHMISHDETRLTCDKCGIVCKNLMTLRRHLMTHSGLKPFMCSKCGKGFGALYTLQCHERIHVGNRCHKCHVCGKGFLEKTYLKRHIKMVHHKLEAEQEDEKWTKHLMIVHDEIEVKEENEEW